MTQHRSGETIGPDALRRFGIADFALWMLSCLLIGGAQAGALYLTTLQPVQPELPGAPPPAIMIELADIAMAPQVEDIAVDDGERSLAPKQAAAADSSAAEDEPPAPEVEPEPVPEPEPAEEPKPIEDVEQEHEPQPPEKRPDDPLPEVAPVETAAVAIPMPVALPASIAEARRDYAAEQQRKREQAEQQQQAASQQTAPRSIQAQQSQQMAAPEQTDTTRSTPTVSPQQWQSQIMSMIERTKRYPDDARRRREEGVIHVQFVIDRSGTVLSARVVRSSGFASLDGAGMELIGRLPKLPAPPSSITDNPISLVVAVNFALR